MVGLFVVGIFIFGYEYGSVYFVFFVVMKLGGLW